MRTVVCAHEQRDRLGKKIGDKEVGGVVGSLVGK